MTFSLREIAERIGLVSAFKQQAVDDLRVPLRYIIGRDNPAGEDGCITMCSFSTDTAPVRGIAAYYVNLFVEEGQLPQYGPYLRPNDTARQYSEGMPVPSGEGFRKNLVRQLNKVVRLGGKYIETDNRDAYLNSVVLDTFDWIWKEYKLKIICKNPGMSDYDQSSIPLLRHPAVVGAIIERGDVHPKAADNMRVLAGKSNLPIWFVSFGQNGRAWADLCASAIKANDLRNMGVTHSNAREEYGSSNDVLVPRKDDA